MEHMFGYVRHSSACFRLKVGDSLGKPCKLKEKCKVLKYPHARGRDQPAQRLCDRDLGAITFPLALNP